MARIKTAKMRRVSLVSKATSRRLSSFSFFLFFFFCILKGAV